MKTCLSILILVVSVFTFTTLSSAQDLPRRAFLGIQAGALTEIQKSETNTGLNIVSVFENSTASRYGVRTGEIVLSAHGRALGEPSDLPAALKGLKAGAVVEFEFLVGSKKLVRSMELQGFPIESYEGTNVLLSSLSVDTGIHRTILTLPDNVRQPPVVYILPGFDCSSMEQINGLETSISKLIGSLSARGYASYRVEKAGVGDSAGKDCLRIGFNEEIEVFKEGLRELKSNQQIDDDRVFLLGISLGGVFAPILAQEKVAGIISFGTISKTWPEYMSDNWRRQWQLAGMSYAEIDEKLKLAASFWHYLVQDGLSPASILKNYPDMEDLSRSLALEDGRSLLLFRHFTFVKELAELNIMSQWEKVTSPTLILWGRGDYVASEADQELIYNELRLNSVNAELAYVDSDHYWTESSNFSTSYSNMRSGVQAPLQESIYDVIVSWLERV